MINVGERARSSSDVYPGVSPVALVSQMARLDHEWADPKLDVSQSRCCEDASGHEHDIGQHIGADVFDLRTISGQVEKDGSNHSRVLVAQLLHRYEMVQGGIAAWVLPPWVIGTGLTRLFYAGRVTKRTSWIVVADVKPAHSHTQYCDWTGRCVH